MLLQVQMPAPARDNVPCMDVANADRPVIKLSTFFGECCLAPVPASNIQTSFEANGQLVFRGQPVVFMVHDHAEMGHFLTVQLAPLVVVSRRVVLLLMQAQCYVYTLCSPGSFWQSSEYHVSQQCLVLH
ncbi:TPA: hypothetical protein ACH3X2_012330 [Trebouxia sp. C0005]